MVEGCGWEKIAQLKEGLPCGALEGGSQPLKMLLKDGSLLEFPQNYEEGPFGKDTIASFGESNSSSNCLGRGGHILLSVSLIT